MSITIYDMLAKVSWETNPQEVRELIKLTAAQDRMVDELKMSNKRLEQQMIKTNDPVKLKKYNDQLTENQRRINSITKATKEQGTAVDQLKKKQQEFLLLLQKGGDPQMVQGLLRNLKLVEDQLNKMDKQVTVLPSKFAGVGRAMLAGIGGGLAAGGLLGLVTTLSSAVPNLIGNALDEAAEAEQGLLRFKQTLDNLGMSEYFDELVQSADDWAKKSKNLFDNDDILAGQAKFIEGTKVTKDQLKELIPVAIDLAAKLSVDVVTASELLTNVIIGKASPELKRLGLNVKGVTTEVGRVNEITGDFAKLLSGSVDTALQTASGGTKQLRQELANLEEDLGNKLLPLQKALTKFKLGLVSLLSDAFATDEDRLAEAIGKKADEYKVILDFKGARLTDKSLQDLIDKRQKEVNLLKEAKEINDKIIAQHKSVNETMDAEKRNRTIINELIEREGRLIALQKFQNKKSANVVFNPNAGADEVADVDKDAAAAAKKTAEDRKRALEESARIIREAKLSLLDEEAREIKLRELKYEDEKKKLYSESAADRLAFEQAYQEDLADIREKYTKRQLDRLDKEIADMNSKVDADFKHDVKAQADHYEELRRMKKQQDDFIQSNFDAIRQYIKDENDKASEEQIENVNELVSNTKDLIAVGQSLLDADINRTEKQISLQEDRLDAARKGSTASVKIEEDRLNDLLEKREKYERAQRTIDAAVIVANQAVAISAAIVGIANAVKDGNAILIAANVVAVLAGLTAGYAAVRSINADQFYDGGYTGEGDPRQESTAVGRRPYTYHKKEYVMNEKLTSKHKDMFDGIHKGDLMVEKIGDSYYLSPKIDVNRAVADSETVRNAGRRGNDDEYITMVNELKDMNGFLRNLKLLVNNNFDAQGFGQEIASQLNNQMLINKMRTGG